MTEKETTTSHSKVELSDEISTIMIGRHCLVQGFLSSWLPCGRVKVWVGDKFYIGRPV